MKSYIDRIMKYEYLFDLITKVKSNYNDDTKFERLDDISSLTKSQLKSLKDAKVQKYMWIVDALATKLYKSLPNYTSVEYDDLRMEGIIELTKQINRFYDLDNPELLKRYWDTKKNDVTIGPFFLRNLKTPVIVPSDTGSIKRIKGALYDFLRNQDELPKDVRSSLNRVSRAMDKYFLIHGTNPSDDELLSTGKISKKDIQRYNQYGHMRKVAYDEELY